MQTQRHDFVATVLTFRFEGSFGATAVVLREQILRVKTPRIQVYLTQLGIRRPMTSFRTKEKYRNSTQSSLLQDVHIDLPPYTPVDLAIRRTIWV